MNKILDKVNSTEDLKKLNIEEKKVLAEDIRELIINTVSKTGGHLASNLGIVELTIALHSIFDMPKDKIVWDVGHQSYVHKILTGRKDKMPTLRQFKGIAGFPKAKESEYDSFDTGHSSTSISAALGMAIARDLKHEDNHIIAVIGDGALTGGMALEALNHAGSMKTNLTVILNDNEMSISKNVGGISLFLSKARTRRFYTESNRHVKNFLNKIMPRKSNEVIRFVRKIKYSIKQLMMPTMLFEDIGFRYLGPVDGHDIEKLENILKISKELDGPVLIHVVTKKGKGYKPAEENPAKFHSASNFDIETGESTKAKSKDYSKAFGDMLIELAKKNEKIVAITAAMKDGTGLTEFANEFPDRIFDVGIAEQHALGLAAGLAKNGMTPVVPIYSSFYQRGYDQVIHDICIQNLGVVMCVDRAGIVGNDGETHQGVFDLSFFSIIPNLTIMAPKDFEELDNMLEYAVTLNKPVVIRYPRGGEGKTKFEIHEAIETGKAEVIKEGEDISIIAIGKMVDRAYEVANILEADGKSCEVINARFLKPIDKKTILESIIKTKEVITIEDNVVKGGLGTAIEYIINEEELTDIRLKKYGYPDEFISHGSVSEIEKKYGLDPQSIAEDVKNEYSILTIN